MNTLFLFQLTPSLILLPLIRYTHKHTNTQTMERVELICSFTKAELTNWYVPMKDSPLTLSTFCCVTYKKVMKIMQWVTGF